MRSSNSPIPALILTRSLTPFPELMEMAVKHKRTVLRSEEDTSLFIPNLTDWLKARLSPDHPPWRAGGRVRRRRAPDGRVRRR